MVKKLLLWVGIAIGVIAIASVVGYVMFNDQVSDTVRTAAVTYLRSRVSGAVADASGGKVDVTFADFDYGFFTRSVSIKGIKVTSKDIAVAIDELACTGLSPWDVLNGEGLSLGTISVVHPVFTINVVDSTGRRTDELAPPDTSIVRLPKIPNVDSLLNVMVAGALPADIAPLSIDAVVVEDGGSTTRQENDTAWMNGTIEGFDLSIRDISLGTGDTVDAHVLSDITISLRRWHRVYSDGRDILMEGGLVRINDADSLMSISHARLISAERGEFIAKGVLFSFANHRLTIDSTSIGTTVPDKEWLAALKHPADRFRIAAEDVAMEDIDLEALTHGTALTVKKVSVGTLMIDVFSNKRGTPPRIKPKQLMPHQIIREIPFTVGIDTLSVSNASVRYAEQQPISPTPGVLTWSKVQAVVTGLTSDIALQHTQPLKISATGLFLDQAEMAATFMFPLNVSVYEMHGEGSLQRMDIRKLNSFLPSVEGIRITSGTADGATFRVDVRGRAARGIVDPVYRGLDIEIVDKKTKKGNWLTGALSFVASWLVVKNDNPRGEDHKVGKIAYTLPPSAALMETIWFPIRSGLGDVAGF